MTQNRLLPILNIVALVITLIINFFSQSASTFGIELFPRTIAQLGESRAIFFLPAGYVFAIWGIIYTGMIAYVIYQSRPKQANNPLHGQIGWWFILSCVGNSVWLVLFLADSLALSTVAITLILVSLLMIYVRLGIGRTQVSRVERWAVHIPFSIYLGWVSVATVANISAFLYESGSVTAFAGINADVWAVVMMSVAVILSALMLVTRRDVAYALVVVWALVGIYARPFTTDVFAPLANLNIDFVNTAAIGLAVVVGLGALVTLILQLRQPRTLAPSAA